MVFSAELNALLARTGAIGLRQAVLLSLLAVAALGACAYGSSEARATSKRSPSGTRRWSGSSSRRRSAARASPTSRSTSTPSSASRPSRSAGRGTRSDLVKIGPTARDLTGGLYDYHLDFPGDALSPGCGYEQWARRISEGHEPTVYAHVATDPRHPGRLALQYWLFYVYNDWNNLHEGDWEMIQLDFDAATAARGARAAAGQRRLQPARRSGGGDLGRRQAPPRRRHPPGRLPGGRLARELLRRRAVPRQLGRAGRRLRQHDGPARRPASRGRDDPERPGAGSRRSSRGSTSRAAGASSSRRSSTARPGRT